MNIFIIRSKMNLTFDFYSLYLGRIYSYFKIYILHSNLIPRWYSWLISRCDVCHLRNITVVPVLTRQPTPKKLPNCHRNAESPTQTTFQVKKSFQRNMIIGVCCCSIKHSNTVTFYFASFRYIDKKTKSWIAYCHRTHSNDSS